MERKQNCLVIALLFILLNSSLSWASLTATESFNTTTNKSSSTMVWNSALGQLHPPLKVIGYDKGSGAENLSFSVGDGRNGSFTSSGDYARLSCTSISGSTIYLDTDSCSDLQFTSFHLQSGWTLNPYGSLPLTIRSLSTITVDGIITCSGGNGTNATSSTSASLAGGSGRCGGGDGGYSVPASTVPTATHRGVAGGTSVVGGSGGPIQDGSAGKGGGGGGAYVKNFGGGSDSPNGTSGKDSTGASVSNVGTNQQDDDFSIDMNGAGSGGGGGSAFLNGSDAGNSSGASGGAGGGSIYFYAVGDINVSSTGKVLAQGGNGGSVSSPYKGGAGGGGGGGSIIMMTVGDIINYGTISAETGYGGSAFTSASGGDGYWGRTWLVEKDGYAGGPVYESPDTKLNSPGDVRYETGVTYTVISKAIDLGNTVPNIISSSATVVNQGGATLTYEVAFGSSPSDTSLSSFAAPATYVGNNVGRFGAFRIQIDNTSATTPATISDVIFTFDGHTQTEFEFEGAACGRVSNIHNDGNRGPWMLFLLLPLLIFALLRSLIGTYH